MCIYVYICLYIFKWSSKAKGLYLHSFSDPSFFAKYFKQPDLEAKTADLSKLAPKIVIFGLSQSDQRNKPKNADRSKQKK